MVIAICLTLKKNCVLQDIPENGADIAHLTYLHGTGVSSGSGTDFKDLLSGKLHSHEWTVKWEPQLPPSGHIGRMTLKLTNIVFGVKIKPLDFYITADQVRFFANIFILFSSVAYTV